MGGIWNRAFLRSGGKSEFCGISLRKLKNQPKNWETFMHTVQKSPPKLRHVYAPRAKSSPKTEARLCTPCKIFPQI